jgi:predicted RNA-binding protein with TRAM domain
MEIPDTLRCLFSAKVAEENDSYRLEVPKHEIEAGALTEGDVYRVAILPHVADASSEESRTDSPTGGDDHPQTPPVTEGEHRDVEIEDIGEQGDGITRVERGFVVIVPETDKGERVTVEITDVGQNVAFATVVERLSYYG